MYTLLGSVLSNTLLVLGMSFLCGGIWSAPDKKSEVAGAQGRGSLLVDSAGGPPMAIEDGGGFVGEKIQSFSVLGALVNTSMLLISCMSFSLVTVFRSVTFP